MAGGTLTESTVERNELAGLEGSYSLERVHSEGNIHTRAVREEGS